jgi:hypothetical protein
VAPLNTASIMLSTMTVDGRCALPVFPPHVIGAHKHKFKPALVISFATESILMRRRLLVFAAVVVCPELSLDRFNTCAGKQAPATTYICTSLACLDLHHAADAVVVMSVCRSVDAPRGASAFPWRTPSARHEAAGHAPTRLPWPSARYAAAAAAATWLTSWHAWTPSVHPAAAAAAAAAAARPAWRSSAAPMGRARSSRRGQATDAPAAAAAGW